MRGRNPLRSAALRVQTLSLLLVTCALVPTVQAQADGYLLGEERRLEIVVHVLGEVVRPGELRVSDDTNVLEALSKAGGGTQFANLNAVTITRLNPRPTVDGSSAEQIIHVNIKNYLKNGASKPLPLLEPGDVISVPRNNLSRWKTTASIIRDLSIVATTYFLYLRTVR